MAQQDRLADNGPEATGFAKPDDDNDRVQKKRKTIAHAQDGIKSKKRKNSGRLRNSPTTRMKSTHRSANKLQRVTP
jgi:hypothetical protein